MRFKFRPKNQDRNSWGNHVFRNGGSWRVEAVDDFTQDFGAKDAMDQDAVKIALPQMIAGSRMTRHLARVDF